MYGPVYQIRKIHTLQCRTRAKPPQNTLLQLDPHPATPRQMAKLLDRQRRFRGGSELVNSSRLALRCLIPTTTQQLPGAFLSPRQLDANSIPGSPGIDINLAPYSHRLHLRLYPLTPPTTFPVVPMPIPPVNHIATTTHPRPTHGGFPGVTPTPHLSRLSLLLMTNYQVIPMPLPATNYIGSTTNPRPSHGGFPHTGLATPNLHLPHTTSRPSIRIPYPRALKRGGTRRPTPATNIITNSSTHPQPAQTRQRFMPGSSPSKHQNYTAPLYRGLPLGAATPPPPPYPRLPQQRWTRLEGSRGIGLATPRPPLRRDAVGLRRPSTPHLAG
jgi:hypothetical protein